MTTLFKSLAALLDKIENTRKRLEIITLTADYMKTLDTEEVEPAISMILGNPLPKQTLKTLDVSWTTLSGILRRVTGADWNAFSEGLRKTGDIGSATKIVFEKAKPKKQSRLLEKSLTITEARRTLETIGETTGSGSKEKKERLLTTLLSQASPIEAKYLIKIFTGEMRTGLHEGLMEQAVAKAFDVPLVTVQKASMTVGDIGEVATIAKKEGTNALTEISFKVFRPVRLMLAQTASDIAEALAEHAGKTAFEYKYDGARVQIHKQNGIVRIFSRRLTDVTQSLPETVKSVQTNVHASEAILEGEVVAVDETDTPIPFQHLMRRFKRVHGIFDTAEKIPIKLYLFDILYLSGKSLVTLPYTQRRVALTENAGAIPLTTQLITDEVRTAEEFLQASIDAGHEGLMAKRLSSPYLPGRRGKNWLKIKPVLEPLDLVIVAAEYGYGRRHNWLSDYYLAAKDTDTGEFLVVGKTFKGLTDPEFTEMTRRLKEIVIREEGNRVVVLPRVVVEVAYNEIQRSPKYKSKMALRFARIIRIREDKSAEDVDTIDRVRQIYEMQFSKKGRYTAE
jgi:DNA ligase-1